MYLYFFVSGELFDFEKRFLGKKALFLFFLSKHSKYLKSQEK
jgi:hypothetical protein